MEVFVIPQFVILQYKYDRNIDLALLYSQFPVNNATHTIQLFPHSKIHKKIFTLLFLSLIHAHTTPFI
jgi:hypothetical protein